ncbi:hypothetical protein WA026_006042 [Henosepilachna vigintioctopunctata]|uniref:Homeobox domain-containing protein n=1 Tax=Henosepilachna vigintioctopunctata TaxID=420089 RepID=A0AAW1TIQ7_9CUCU
MITFSIIGKTRTKDKYRVVYSDVQRVELEREFHFHNKYITIRRKAELAIILGLSERQIKIWFQNRRAKERKQLKKAAEEKSRNLNRPNNNHEIPSYEGMVNQHMMQPNNALPAEQLLPAPANHPIVHPSYSENHHISDRLMKLEMNDDQIG